MTTGGGTNGRQREWVVATFVEKFVDWGACVTAGTRSEMGGATRDGGGGGRSREGGRQGGKARMEGRGRENDSAEDVGEDGAGISAGRTGAGAWCVSVDAHVIPL
jgi:hypothetical protein